jgi:hypothetical protein
VKPSELSNMSHDELQKLTLHKFLTGKQLLRLIVKEHTKSGFEKAEEGV